MKQRAPTNPTGGVNGTAAGEKRRIRCAIYTRKSSEEGLDQEYNSLDAQRDAGEAYVASQKNEGWICLPSMKPVPMSPPLSGTSASLNRWLCLVPPLNELTTKFYALCLSESLLSPTALESSHRPHLKSKTK